VNSIKNQGNARHLNTYLPRVLVCTLLGLGLALSVVSGCNTVKGAGADLERGGEKLQNSAERHGAQ